MFRQISLHPKHHCLQQILWRESPQQELQVIQLTTVTYGLTASSFLASNCLKKLALENVKTHPLAAEALLHNTYMDDILIGKNCLTETLELQNQLIELLSLAKFELHKWCANHPQLLENIPRATTF